MNKKRNLWIRTSDGQIHSVYTTMSGDDKEILTTFGGAFKFSEYVTFKDPIYDKEILFFTKHIVSISIQD